MTIQLVPPQDIDDVLNEPEPEYDWLIPNLLELGDRFILTGGEGKGKSTFLRQLAIQVACGVHPFTLEPVEARRVLLIDLENSKSSVRRKLKEIIGDHQIPDGGLQVARWPEGIDLSNKPIQSAMNELLDKARPEFIIIGPTYKMAPDLNTEEGSAELAFLIDRWRKDYRCCIGMESHQPHTTVVEGKRFRPERPFGSSLWMRWPEFGLCLEDGGNLRHWRGPREERDWPEKLRWGDEWPWVVDSRLCMVCDSPLSETQEKYCTPKCKNQADARNHRARLRTT